MGQPAGFSRKMEWYPGKVKGISGASPALHLIILVLRDEVRVPASALLHDTLLCRVIHVDQAEAFAIALGPLKVIQEGPDNVALDGDALAYDLGNGLNMRPQVVYALLIVNIAVAVPVIVEGSAAFGDNHRFWSVLAVNARQDVGEAIGEDLPAHFSVGRAGDALDGFKTIGVRRVFSYSPGIFEVAHQPARVVVDAEEVNGR